MSLEISPFVLKEISMRFRSLLCAALVALPLLVTAAADPKLVSAPADAVPPNIVTTANRPMVMLASSKDHTLFGPIYTDFEDIDADGKIDTTFIPTFKYYGYFDPTKCYAYSTGDNRFNPSSIATVTGGRYTCSSASSLWSGNFLNWATMTRVDVIRKMLYGGYRSTDTSSTTVLSRANLSKDSHSFVKYYRGDDIRDYTPFTTAALTKSTGSNRNVYAGLSICNRSTDMGPNGDPVIRLAKGNYRLWATVEGTVCEWSAGAMGKKLSRYFKDTDKGAGGIAHEESPPKLADDGATYGSVPAEIQVRVLACKADMLGEERCQAFPPDSVTNYKPFGLLQEFGFSPTDGGSARAEFGVITGSYDKNLTAGALRKNMGDFSDEINRTTGVFCHSASSGCAATLADGRKTGQGAIKALDSLKLFGRNGSSYDGSNVQLPSELTDGTLPAWGNPVGEMVVQALQYFAGKTSTNPGSNTNDTATGLPTVAWKDPLSNDDATRKSLYGNSICRPLYTLALSSSALSFDGQADTAFATLPAGTLGSLASYTNAVGVAEGVKGTSRSVGSVSGGFGETCSAKTVGNLSDVSGICPDAPGVGGTYQVAGAALYANTQKIRAVSSPPPDLKYVQDALKVKTLAASLSGGAARIEVPIPGTSPQKYVYITPESLWASNANAKRMPGAMLTFASISSSDTHGAFVVTWNDSLFGGDYDMDIAGFLRYDVIKSGNSYQIKITTDILNVGAGWTGTHGFSVIGVKNTDGTTADGRYLTHRHLTDDSVLQGAEGHLCRSGYSDAVKKSNVCNTSTAWNQIRDEDVPISLTFNMVGVQDVILQDPLWYAAKYGDFASSSKNPDGTYTDVALPSSTESWDKVRADGSPGTDGIPDGYFLARRPDLLEEQLRKALDTLARNSNAAPAVSSSQLVSDSFKYIAKFDSTTVDGNIEAYKVDSLGYFAVNPTWRAGNLLRFGASGSDGNGGDKGDSRRIITNGGNSSGSALAFRWASLTDPYKAQMTTASLNVLSATNAEFVLDYMRGDQRKEGPNGLRVRGDNLLGPVINGTPWIQDRPRAYYPEADFPGYGAFATAQRTRDKLLWVGANDGMLHAFNAETGAEVFAYVPGALANRLAEIPLQRGTIGRTRLNGNNFVTGSETLPNGTVWPYVDGSPYTGDVKLGTGVWKTYVFGSLGRGGKSIYALDATALSNLTGAEASPSTVFKWQFTRDDDDDLGYVVGDVTVNATSKQAAPIVKLNNGKFALVVGNGQKSTNGKAVLYLLYVDGPSGGSWNGQYKKIIAASPSGKDSGLSTPTWVDLDGNGTADVVYAGDLKGNLWKFNLSSSDPANWDVAYKSGGTNKPLFTAKDDSTPAVPLPITAAPEFAFSPYDGLIITFATGNAFGAADFPIKTRVQRVYGIWDRPNFSVTGGRALPTDLTTLVPRTYQRQSDGSVIVSGTPDGIDWTTKDGWYFNLPGTSEMVLSDPEIRAGVLTFTTVRPKTTVDNCSNTPDAALYTIDPVSGKAERNSQGITNISGTSYVNAGADIPDQKVKVVSDRTKRNFTKECRAGEPGCTCKPVDGGQSCEKDKPTCAPGQSALRVAGQGTDVSLCYSPNARVQWREIPGLRTDQ
jgi:type IV pilus assembly protein PilY1